MNVVPNAFDSCSIYQHLGLRGTPRGVAVLYTLLVRTWFLPLYALPRHVEHLELPSPVICVLTGVASGSLVCCLPPITVANFSPVLPPLIPHHAHPFLISPHSFPHNQPSLAALANGLLLAHRRLHLCLVPTPIHQNLRQRMLRECREKEGEDEMDMQRDGETKDTDHRYAIMNKIERRRVG